MSNEIILPHYDWNEEWKLLQQTRRQPASAESWDARATTFSSKDAPSNYVKAFMDLVDILSGETIFDMGCGNGALALPFARRGHKIVACDFSQGMLDVLQRDADAENVLTDIDIHCLSWDDDWKSAGIEPKCADVAFASRSIATSDLRSALVKLNDVAKRRVCITLTTGVSPRTDTRLLHALGLTHHIGYDFMYAFNILASMGALPEVSYIQTSRDDTFDSYEEALDTLARMVRDAAETDEQEREAMSKLTEWLKHDLIENPEVGQDDHHNGIQKAYMLSKPRTTSWAFIAWDVV